MLQRLGIAARNGAIRASMRGKYNQINAFLREIDTLLPPEPPPRRYEIVDCGAGLAYLSLAACCYLRYGRGFDVGVTGIERDGELVAKSNQTAADLALSDSVRFLQLDLESCSLEVRPDLLLALHACDDATDAAIARGVEWQAGAILAAPCCQHELQRQIVSRGPMRALLRHNILRERQADLLTDACRAQLLRILGYRVQVVEFVAFADTARNIMLRATAGVRAGESGAVADYLALRDFWQIEPALERMLAPQLKEWLGSDEDR